MPIRPSEKARYPKDWKQIRARIMERADNHCECRGECGESHAIMYDSDTCGAPHGELIIRDKDDPQFFFVHSVCGGCVGGDPDCARAVRVVLTVAHLDHTPENNAPENLRAFCQRCHLRYDAKLHAKNARETRRSRKAIGDLFDGVPR